MIPVRESRVLLKEGADGADWVLYFRCLNAPVYAAGPKANEPWLSSLEAQGI